MGLNQVDLEAHVGELQSLAKSLGKVDEPFVATSWVDTSETWLALYELLRVFKSDVCCMVLRCIFSDPDVRRALGAARQFSGIEGEPPSSLLKHLKSGLSKHIKKRFYVYNREIESEMANIRRIQELQARAIALLGTGIVSAMIGTANFVSNIMYDEFYVQGKPFPLVGELRSWF